MSSQLLGDQIRTKQAGTVHNVTTSATRQPLRRVTERPSQDYITTTFHAASKTSFRYKGTDYSYYLIFYLLKMDSELIKLVNKLQDTFSNLGEFYVFC